MLTGNTRPKPQIGAVESPEALNALAMVCENVLHAG